MTTHPFALKSVVEVHVLFPPGQFAVTANEPESTIGTCDWTYVCTSAEAALQWSIGPEQDAEPRTIAQRDPMRAAFDIV